MLKINKSWVKFLLLAVSAVLINSVVRKTLTENAFNNLYPIEADSIGMPMAYTFFSFIALIPFAAVFCTANLSRQKVSDKYSIAWFTFRIISYVFSYLLLTFVVLASASYWNTPHHYAIAKCYIALLFLIQAFFIFDLYQIYTRYKAG